MNVDELSRPEATAILSAKTILTIIAKKYAKVLDEILNELKIPEDKFDDSLDQLHHMSAQIFLNVKK